MRAHFANVRLFFAATDRVRRLKERIFSPPTGRESVEMRQLPPLRSASEQWARVSAVLGEAHARAERAIASHSGATAQLDAATYALQRLREELSPALAFTVPRKAAQPSPTALRTEPFRRREPLAA